MIRPSYFYDLLKQNDIRFFAGVPDSLLKNLCAFLTDNVEKKNNIIAANEGGAMGLAAGYYLSTGKIPVVYMQNSGLGNTVNPLLSLTDKEVYSIPVLLIIGWRGEPGVHDEPQHVKQGKLTLPLLDTMGIKHEILTENEAELAAQIGRANDYMLRTKESFALVVRKGTFDDYKLQNAIQSSCNLIREEAIGLVAATMQPKDVVVSTTGMISRELFEYRTTHGEGHECDFLTVGSMGHASQIALGIALNQPQRNVYCFDGDGATIMHMGSLSITASMQPANYYHIVFNNGAHDSVGGQPTVGLNINLTAIAKDCGYKTVLSVDSADDLQKALATLTRQPAPALLEVKVKKGARKDLGRPTTTPVQNKEALMDFLQKK